MKKRIVLLVLGGGVLLVAMLFASRYMISRSRPQTNAEWQAERNAEHHAKWKADLRKGIVEALANATNPRDRRLYEYDLLLLDRADESTEIASLVKASDGIDEFEALLIARVYFEWQFGACGSVALPEMSGQHWIATIAAAREAKPQPSITIDAKSGAIQCAGHPPIGDVMEFLRKWPNKAPEPTPTSVMPRANE